MLTILLVLLIAYAVAVTFFLFCSLAQTEKNRNDYIVELYGYRQEHRQTIRRMRELIQEVRDLEALIRLKDEELNEKEQKPAPELELIGVMLPLRNKCDEKQAQAQAQES